MAVRKRNALAGVFEETDRVTNLHAQSFGMPGEQAFIVAIAEDNLGWDDDEFFKHFFATDVTKVNQRFSPCLQQRFHRPVGGFRMAV
jgi:hypothetical protein